jgi:hypothetical protein
MTWASAVVVFTMTAGVATGVAAHSTCITLLHGCEAAASTECCCTHLTPDGQLPTTLAKGPVAALTAFAGVAPAAPPAWSLRPNPTAQGLPSSPPIEIDRPTVFRALLI